MKKQLKNVRKGWASRMYTVTAPSAYGTLYPEARYTRPYNKRLSSPWWRDRASISGSRKVCLSLSRGGDNCECCVCECKTSVGCQSVGFAVVCRCGFCEISGILKFIAWKLILKWLKFSIKTIYINIILLYFSYVRKSCKYSNIIKLDHVIMKRFQFTISQTMHVITFTIGRWSPSVLLLDNLSKVTFVISWFYRSPNKQNPRPFHCHNDLLYLHNIKSPFD